jgi:hypothetical protein
MNSRRHFVKTVAAAGVLGAMGSSVSGSSATLAPAPSDGHADRRYWITVLQKLAQPILGRLSRRELKQSMPVETSGKAADRQKYTHLEAFGRLLAGIAPWLEARDVAEAEAQAQRQFIGLAQAALDAATDPPSPDYMNFRTGGQPLVDAAFLAQGILRAPQVLWASLEPRVRQQVIDALKLTRAIQPGNSNWVMFAATVEAALLEMGEATIEARLENYVRRMLGWYLGDGVYGDGELFHFDYYNSFVIHPMLVDVLSVLRRKDARFESAYSVVVRRARRYAEIQERLIAPEGTFPAVGRSIAYRFGAFHALAQTAWRRELPEGVKPAQVRGALTAVMRRMIEAPGTFDENGWLRIGFCGHQPALGEGYISTGSLYLCSVGLLPLGLSPTDAFWNDPPARWTAQRIWTGEPLPADHAMSDDAKAVEIPTLKRQSG